MATCLDYFSRLLGRQEYSTYELLKKGKEKGFDPNEITEAIEHLQNLGYQSDARLVERLIASSRGKYGKSVIKRKCWEKGIANELFEQIWEEQTAEQEQEIDELADLKAKVMRKYKIEDWENLDPKTQNKVFNYLRYRGFNPVELWEQWQREDSERY